MKHWECSKTELCSCYVESITVEFGKPVYNIIANAAAIVAVDGVAFAAADSGALVGVGVDAVLV
jgi:hypothetical protein